MPHKFPSNPRFELSKNLRIGILLGGNSSERKISLRSGRAVDQALRGIGYHSVKIDPRSPQRMQSLLSRIDVAFIALHGQGGEDGTVQKLLTRKNIPYIGSDVHASRRAFDKCQAKKIFRKNGVPTPPFTLVTAKNWKSRLRGFPTPFVIKPLCEGSSIGVFFVEDFAKCAEKIRKALKGYGMLLAEKKIIGREFTVGILGDRALPVVELKPKRSFYDYRAKYTSGMTDYLVPAPISKKIAKRIQAAGLSAHQALGLRDFSRVDIMLDEKNRPFVLEANSIPGFTALSLLPKAARAAGISFEDLCCRLVHAAWKRSNGKISQSKGFNRG
ncbi:MAG: D-alanine--D-alanine ligase [Candidatus Omnitrophica bacterium]|nr:D-alanine--D-alanine ligase [Candidatus Omnitrophota bacterium]